MKIIASNNAFVYDELAAPGFQLVKPQTVVVSSGDEALDAVRRHAPELAILDAEMPGLDGYAVCERIKADPATRLTRVILALQGTISARQLQRLAACGCDDVVVFRLPGEDLYRHVARLLGLPDPSHGEPVELEVEILHLGQTVTGRALQLADTGAALVIPRPVPAGARITLRLRRHAEPEWLEVSGEVIDVERTSSGPSTIARVVFHQVADDVRKRLVDLAFWDARQLPTGQHIRFRGSFDEGSDFTRVKKALGKEVVFDLSGIRAINSWGVRHWIMFLRNIPAETTYCFVNASVIFVKHCNMVVDMLGRGPVVSFVAPYECSSCGLERDRTLQVSSVTRAIQQDPPEFRCGVCGGVEKFAELPERYFAFLRDKPA